MTKQNDGSETAVAYFRVSMREQEASGLGLNAQRSAVEKFCKERGLRLIAEFRAIETGKRNERPGLAQVLECGRIQGAELIIAKLNGRSRNAAFILRLRDSGVRFVAADMPEANTLTVGIMALLA